MPTPYGIEIIENCLTCKLRADRMFCDLPAETLAAFDAITYANLHPHGAVLFVEGQEPRGIYVVCSGRVKLSTCGPDGKTIIPIKYGRVSFEYQRFGGVEKADRFRIGWQLNF